MLNPRFAWVKELLGWGTALILLLLALGPAWGDSDAEKGNYRFSVFGDMPYRMPMDEGLMADLIGRINAEKPAFVVNVGDIKNGSTRCSEETYQKMFRVFQTIEAPVLYTPGDNEWTDCQRVMCGEYNPAERLDVLRGVFYRDPALLEKSLPVAHENAVPGFERYVENARWSVGPVQYLTLHVVGSNNSLLTEKGRFEEYHARNKANLYWLSESFAEARAQHRRGVVIFIHADPFLPPEKAGQHSGFTDFLNTLKAEAEASDLEVLLMHGDSHLYRVDMPFHNAKTYETSTKITRVVVFGSPDMHAVQVEVTPQGPHLFTVRPLL